MANAWVLAGRHNKQSDWLIGVLLVVGSGHLGLAVWTLARPDRRIACILAALLLLPPLPFALGDSGPHPYLFFAGFGGLADVLWLRHWEVPITPLNGALGSLFAMMMASIAPAAIYSGSGLAGLSLVRVFLLGVGIYLFLFTAYGPSSRFDAFSAIRFLRFCARRPKPRVRPTPAGPFVEPGSAVSGPVRYYKCFPAIC